MRLLAITFILLSACANQSIRIYDEFPKSGHYKESFEVRSNEYYQVLNTSISGKKPLRIISDFYTNQKIYSDIPTGPVNGLNQLKDFIWKKPNKISKLATCIKTNNKYYTYLHLDKRNVSLPIINLSINPSDFFSDSTGIYVPGKLYNANNWKGWWPSGNFSQKWKRKAFLQYFNPQGQLEFETDIKLKVVGFGVSGFPQKSLKLYFPKYTNKQMQHLSFIKTLDYTPRTLLLRNSGQDFVSTHLRDVFAQSLLDSSNVLYQKGQAVIVCINGEYWGIKNIREKFDATNFKNKYQTKHIDIIENENEVISGSYDSFDTLMHYVRKHGLTKLENYDWFCQNVDIENYIDYLIFQTFIANHDWPGVNQLRWKKSKSKDKWKWVAIDTDYSFGFDHMTHKGYDYNYNAFSNLLEENGPNWPNPEWSTLIPRKLFENKRFRELFKEKAVSQLETRYSPKRLTDQLDKWTSIYKQEMPYHIQRWQYPNSMDQWYKELDHIKTFIKRRHPVYLTHLEEVINNYK